MDLEVSGFDCCSCSDGSCAAEEQLRVSFYIVSTGKDGKAPFFKACKVSVRCDAWNYRSAEHAARHSCHAQDYTCGKTKSLPNLFIQCWSLASCYSCLPTRVRGGTLNSPTKAAELGTPCKHKGDALEGRQRPANSGRLLWAAKDAHQPHAKGLGLNTFRSLSTGCLTSPHAHTKLSEQIERINICTIYLYYTYIMYNMCIYISYIYL